MNSHGEKTGDAGFSLSASPLGKPSLSHGLHGGFISRYAVIGAESPLTAPEVAACGTISNELLSRMGARLPVVWTQKGEK